MARNNTLTPSQVREHFRLQGKTLTQWAKEQGFPRQAVYRVMAGQDKAYFGRAHEIAVALGLKPSTPDGERNQQSRRAA